MSEAEKKPKLKLRPTDGVVDYAAEYKKIIKNDNELIESAKYFLRMRKSHLTEILNTWDDVEEDMSLEQAALVLNEFLSPTCTLLEFEFMNLTKAGKEQAEQEKNVAVDQSTINEIWQKHILGRVITNRDHEITVRIPANAKSMFKDSKTKNRKSEEAELGNQEVKKAGTSNSREKPAIEIFTIYKQIRWFIKNVEVDELTVSRFMRTDIKKSIDDFNRSLSTTWKAVNCLVYMEIVESLRSDPSNTIAVVFGKCSKMMIEEKHGVLSKESSDLLKCANLFILKYRGGSDEEELFRCGFGYLGAKLQILKSKQENDPSILNVASSLAEEEAKITDVYELLKGVYDFSTCEV